MTKKQKRQVAHDSARDMASALVTAIARSPFWTAFFNAGREIREAGPEFEELFAQYDKFQQDPTPAIQARIEELERLTNEKLSYKAFGGDGCLLREADYENDFG